MKNDKNKVYKIKHEHGYYIFRLGLLLDEIGKSRYVMSRELQMEYKVLNRYIQGNLSRFDTSIIAKICDYCHCKMSDIIEYYPDEN